MIRKLQSQASHVVTEQTHQILVHRVDRLEERLNGLSGRPTTTVVHEGSGDDHLYRDLAMRVNQLQHDLDNLRNEFAKWMK